MRRYLLFQIPAILFLLIAVVSAADDGLTPEIIEQSRSSYNLDEHTRAMYNAITNNDINNLALNRDILRSKNELFSHKIKVKDIIDQKSSGRCWVFAWLNTMRPKVIARHNLKAFEFSQNYLAFWDKMEKANTFLEYMIEFRDRDPLDRELMELLRNPLPDGGYWVYAVRLIEKYGAVPKEIMPETNSSGNTKIMNQVIGQKLRKDAARIREMSVDGVSVDAMREYKRKSLIDVYKMLAMNLGEPPTEFEYRYETKDSVVSDIKEYTPVSFYKDFIGIELDDYVCLFDNPTREYGGHFKVNMSRNMYDGEDFGYASVDIAKIKEIALKSVLDDEPMYVSCDVGKDQSTEYGLMARDLYDYSSIFGVDLNMTKKDMALYLQSSSNHGMALVGVDVRDGRPVKWLLENSWGDKKGNDGYWTLYDDWFNDYVYGIIVKKKYVPENILKIFDKTPIILPPWDPMSAFAK